MQEKVGKPEKTQKQHKSFKKKYKIGKADERPCKWKNSKIQKSRKIITSNRI